jgi:hypothetical protein
MPAREGGLRPVHPLVLRSPLARISGLQQYRVIHDSSGLTVEAVLSEPHGDVAASIVQALRSALHEHGIDPPAIRVDSVREIARHGQSGKMKLIEARGATR